MLRQYTDDPPADWDAHCREQDALHDMLPMCCECGQRIEDEISVCDDVDEAYSYFRQCVNHNPDDCCNLRKG